MPRKLTALLSWWEEEEIDYALEALDHRFPGGIWGLAKGLVKGALGG